MHELADSLERVAALLAAHDDIVCTRADGTTPPAWCEGRGWSSFLLGLSDDEVTEAERHGLANTGAVLTGAPSDLLALCDAARHHTAPFLEGPRDLEAIERQRVKLRKRTQVAALVDHLRELALPIERVVDMGSGHGHLTRALHRELEVNSCGIERDGELVRVARALSSQQAVAFIEGPVADEQSIVRLDPNDLVVGLHACGALGDALLRGAAGARASVLLVSCCQQKIEHSRRAALSRRGAALGVSWPRPLLGLSNLSWGVHASASMHGREVRHALRLLLKSRGSDEREGDVARGINKRRFRRDLETVALPALELRGHGPASTAEIRQFERLGREEFASIRRLSLPRSLLGRLMELAIVLDRANYLLEEDYDVKLRAMFDIDVSPRNLGLIATPRARAGARVS